MNDRRINLAYEPPDANGSVDGVGFTAWVFGIVALSSEAALIGGVPFWQQHAVPLFASAALEGLGVVLFITGAVSSLSAIGLGIVSLHDGIGRRRYGFGGLAMGMSFFVLGGLLLPVIASIG